MFAAGDSFLGFFLFFFFAQNKVRKHLFTYFRVSPHPTAMEVSGPGIEFSHSINLSCCRDSTASLTYCATVETPQISVPKGLSKGMHPLSMELRVAHYCFIISLVSSRSIHPASGIHQYAKYVPLASET